MIGIFVGFEKVFLQTKTGGNGTYSSSRGKHWMSLMDIGVEISICIVVETLRVVELDELVIFLFFLGLLYCSSRMTNIELCLHMVALYQEYFVCVYV